MTRSNPGELALVRRPVPPVASALRNARWLPGLAPIRGGSCETSVLRCAEFEDIHASGLSWVQGLRPALVLDLRSVGEMTRPHPCGSDPSYRQRPFIDVNRDQERDPDAEHSRADLYRGSLDRNGTTIVAVLMTILSTPPGPILVHCKSGVDRTGMLVALVLDALGVDRGLVAADYATYRPAPGEPPPPDPPELTTVTAMFNHLDTRFGGSLCYLLSHGMPANTPQLLASRLPCSLTT